MLCLPSFFLSFFLPSAQKQTHLLLSPRRHHGNPPFPMLWLAVVKFLHGFKCRSREEDDSQHQKLLCVHIGLSFCKKSPLPNLSWLKMNVSCLNVLRRNASYSYDLQRAFVGATRGQKRKARWHHWLDYWWAKNNDSQLGLTFMSQTVAYIRAFQGSSVDWLLHILEWLALIDKHQGISYLGFQKEEEEEILWRADF